MSLLSASPVLFLNSSTSMTEPQMMKTAYRDTCYTINQQPWANSVQSTLEGFKPLKTHFHSNCCFKLEAEVNGKTKCPLLWPEVNVNASNRKVRLRGKQHARAALLSNIAKNGLDTVNHRWWELIQYNLTFISHQRVWNTNGTQQPCTLTVTHQSRGPGPLCKI